MVVGVVSWKLKACAFGPWYGPIVLLFVILIAGSQRRRLTFQKLCVVILLQRSSLVPSCF
jgi:hypothetical protein